jgi:hypothetical protein
VKRTVKTAWAAALMNQARRHVNGVHALRITGDRRGDVVSPLGVLCELAVDAGVIERGDDITVDAARVATGYPPGYAVLTVATYGRDHEYRILPAEVVRWAGLASNDPLIIGVFGNRRTVNDMTIGGMNCATMGSVIRDSARIR